MADIVHVAFENKAISVTRFALDQILPHIRPYGCWSGGVEIVVGVHLLRWKISGQASEAGNSTHHGVHNGLNQRRRDRGVNGIATGGEYVPARLCGLGLRSYDHALLHQIILLGAVSLLAARCKQRSSWAFSWQQTGESAK